MFSVAAPGRTVECPVFEGGFAAVEAEIVICVGARRAAPTRSTGRSTKPPSFVGELRIGVEIASSPLATLNDLGPGAVVSDFGNNWGVVVGTAVQRLARARTKSTAQASSTTNLVGRGVAFDAPRPARRPRFHAGKCARRGRPLRAGAVISTGMITGVHDIRPGQRSRHVFEGCGEVVCRAVRATTASEARMRLACG